MILILILILAETWINLIFFKVLFESNLDLSWSNLVLSWALSWILTLTFDLDLESWNLNFLKLHRFNIQLGISRVSSFSRHTFIKLWIPLLIPRSSNKQFQLHTHNEWKNSPVSSLIFNNTCGNPLDIFKLFFSHSPEQWDTNLKLIFLLWLLAGPKSYPSLSYQMTFKK